MQPSWTPTIGDVFLDDRDGDRALRVSWHPEVGLVVLSLWRGGQCVATFRLPAAELPGFLSALAAGPATAAAR